MIEAVLNIVVDLSDQKLYAYSEDSVYEFVVSTGKPSTPTPVMEEVIDRKYEVTDLYGPGYYLHDVPYVMCFKDHAEYCIHPNTTSKPLGEPHSMGCVRMSTEDAGWLFDRVEVGTPIKVVL